MNYYYQIPRSLYPKIYIYEWKNSSVRTLIYKYTEYNDTNISKYNDIDIYLYRLLWIGHTVYLPLYQSAHTGAFGPPSSEGDVDADVDADRYPFDL